MFDNSYKMYSIAKKIKNQSYILVRRATEPLQCVYIDFQNLSREIIGNIYYFLSLINNYIRYSWLFIKLDRRVESLVQILDIWLLQVQHQSRWMLLVIQMDNIVEFKVLVIQGKSKGIEFKFIEPGTPPQNSVVKWFNKIILKIARVLLFNTRFYKKYWKYAVMVTDYLQNRIMLVKDSNNKNKRKRTLYKL